MSFCHLNLVEFDIFSARNSVEQLLQMWYQECKWKSWIEFNKTCWNWKT